MRAFHAARSADRISRSAIVLAGALCGVLVFFVAVPLALSSPFPSLKEETWIINRSSLQAAISVPAVIEPPTVLVPEAPETPWSFVSLPPSGAAGSFAPVESDEPQSTATISLASASAALASEASGQRGKSKARAPDTRPEPGSSARATPVDLGERPAPAKRVDVMDEVDEYLWEVYQRAPVKKDGAGDFTWKDPAAAKRMGMSMPVYVVGGMDRDFREQLYHAGRAMDAAGIRWAILSAFRDDYRQTIASGLKAGASNSLHGGKARTGGYGHGQAADVTGEDGNNEDAVWQWLDRHGSKYGLYRPMPGADPAHVQSRGDWHQLAVAMRDSRVRTADDMRASGAKTAKVGDKASDVIKASW